ncbi:MAG: Deacetylase family protein [Candidatus Methanohalarchaeum thermophilum]|uniref:Deacetylase family protein n=1 Tax=Methanohalarchaeum thermophilum TaxID=1903181 RepID=A0A1Q6DS67_METT1|nr:MAG: Deacetylase family protein [Candidatus Methanohalarchaeum thermophilum]
MDRSFALIRPGGHHAFKDHGHGFCFTNNTSIMIKKALKKYDLDRVLLWDWDAHHFDGTQSIFYENKNVLTISTHQDGRTLFPGTGSIEENGKGKGRGYNMNIPLKPGSSDKAYLEVTEKILKPAAASFKPDLLVIQAGQDNHYTDPLTDLDLTAKGYARLMKKAVETAKKHCNSKTVSILGGGYGIEGGLPYTNLAVIAAMAKLDTSNIREPKKYEKPDLSKKLTETRRLINKIKQEHPFKFR